MAQLEELGKKLKLRVRKKENGVVKMMARHGGRNGVVEIDAEIFQIGASNYMVEIKKSNGDNLEYQKMLKEEILPGKRI